ncbi:boophilin-G2 [Ixodes scapularis]|uniref:Putative trypsin inhibitor n=1 Tax=Ixodes scapularis TaxID=6945 RepID=A0A4D5RTZ9_IXOSC
MKVLLVFFLVGTVSAQWNEICKLSPDKGVCRARVSRFYFNQSSGQCLPFIYGGCMGNPNNFWTIEDCEAACKNAVQDEFPENEDGSSYFDTACKPTPERGFCKGFLDRWFFNVTSGACETFLYSGCGGNLNEYKSQWECEFACMG